LDERRFVPPRGGNALEQVAFVASVARGLVARMGGVVDDRGQMTLLPYGTPIATSGNVAVDASSQDDRTLELEMVVQDDASEPRS
jgi:hypothetical protein